MGLITVAIVKFMAERQHRPWMYCSSLTEGLKFVLIKNGTHDSLTVIFCIYAEWLPCLLAYHHPQKRDVGPLEHSHR
jgi:hypothetical protein